MADLPSLLNACLQPNTRKAAEQSLNELSIQPGFLSHLLRLVLEPSQDRAVRLSGSVFLKNIAKMRWDEIDAPLPSNDKAELRSQLVPAMLSLSGPSDKAIRAQVAESVSLIAALDFPTVWPDLIDQLVGSLSATDYSVNVGVLETAHSIFRQWRAHVRSDELFTEINLVLKKFMTPFLQLFRQTAGLLFSDSTPATHLPQIAQAQALLIEIYYDFTCQDLPPDIEDSQEEFFSPNYNGVGGYFPRFLLWDPPSLRGDDEDTTASLPSKIKTGIFELSELFIKLYPDQLTRFSVVPELITKVWALVGSGKLPSVGDDILVSQALRFVSAAIRTNFYKDLFSSKETISGLVEGVVIPNVGLREHEMEQFEDDPLEFIRLDLALPGADTSTRRQAAADVLQALVGSGLEGETTEIVSAWIGTGLSQYASDPVNGWKAKDSAIYLLTALATRGSTTQQGVTSTNALVDVVKFFSDHVYEDLKAASGSVHPILQVDAIRFLHTFRNQLTKEQLLGVLPLLVGHIGSDNYVTYTYAAITIERVLFIKQQNRLVFSQTDVQDVAPGLLNAILSKIESAGTAEKIAENDHLMKCAMRVIVTAKQTLTPGYEGTLQRIVAILGVISKNPSNPNFDQYIFESLSALMRFVVAGSPATLATFEGALFQPFLYILQQDIDQYIPYVFQILAQMLELHHAEVPENYRSLLPHLLTPAIWGQKGSIPGLVKLLKAFLVKDSQQMVATGQFTAVLGIIQQRLIPSKQNDSWGFELLQGVVQNIPPTTLKPYFKGIMVTLLTRMQTSKTDKFVYLFALFASFTMAIPIEGLGPDYFIGTMEEIQAGLWPQVLSNMILPEISKMPHKDRKVVVVGATRLLTQSKYMLQEPSIQGWPPVFTALVSLFREPQYLKEAKVNDSDVGFTEIDHEEQTAGYQAAYSKLAGAEKAEADPVAYVRDPREYLGQELVKLSKTEARTGAMIQATGDPAVAAFVAELKAAGFSVL